MQKYILVGKGEDVKGENIGDKIDTSNDKKYAAKTLNEWIKQGFGIEGNITSNDVSGLTYAKFEEKKFKLSDGREVTGREIREAAAAAEMKEKIGDSTKKDTEIMLDLEKAGVNTDLAYFLGENTVDNWEGKTLSGLKKAANDALAVSSQSFGGETVDTNAIAQALKTEAEAIQTFIIEQSLDYSIDTLSEMSEQDRINLGNALKKAQAGGRKDDLLNVLGQYKDDPEMFAKVARQASTVDFTNKFAAADFFFKHTDEIQTKIRKKELDYFKNINAELDKVNRELEHAVGLEKQRLLDRQIALEQESQMQAIQESQDAKQVFDTYVQAHGEDELYLNEDGSLNIRAVNDKIATLDEEADKEEIQYLNNLLNYWGDVIDAEAAAEEAAYKVIDAQMAAFNYQFEAWDHLQELIKKYSEFIVDMQKVIEQGFDAFDEETIRERLDNAFSSWDTTLALIEEGKFDPKTYIGNEIVSTLNKAINQVSWLVNNEENTSTLSNFYNLLSNFILSNKKAQEASDKRLAATVE